MDISSESTSTSLRVVRKLVSIANMLTNVLVCSYMIAMSYNHMPAEPIHVLYLGIVRVILSNIFFTISSKEYLQAYEDSPFQTMLSNHMILGPIAMITDLVVLWLLITGSLVGWGWYLTYVVCISIIGMIHKRLKYVKVKKW